MRLSDGVENKWRMAVKTDLKNKKKISLLKHFISLIPGKTGTRFLSFIPYFSHSLCPVTFSAVPVC